MVWDLSSNMDITYTGNWIYFMGSLFFIAVWLILFIAIPRSRRPMLWSSVTLMLVAPLFDYLNQADYWNPEFLFRIALDLPGSAQMTFGIEGMMLGFGVAGISAGTFDYFLRREDPGVITGITWGSYGRLWHGSLLAVAGIFLTHFLFGINSVRAHIYALAALSILFFWKKRASWIRPSIKTAASMIVVMAVFYYAYFLRFWPDVIEDWWKLDQMWGIILWGVPLEEFLWAGANAMYLGIMVRYCMRLDLDKENA